MLAFCVMAPQAVLHDDINAIAGDRESNPFYEPMAA
jgi:hypothetical protein